MMFQNKTLARFLAIKQEISRLEKEQKEIKSQIEKAGGNFETSEFTVSTLSYEVNRVCDAETLCAAIDPVTVAKFELIKTTTSKRLNVERKELAKKSA